MKKILYGILVALSLLSFCLSDGYYFQYIMKWGYSPQWYESGLALFWILVSLFCVVLFGWKFLEETNA